MRNWPILEKSAGGYSLLTENKEVTYVTASFGTGDGEGFFPWLERGLAQIFGNGELVHHRPIFPPVDVKRVSPGGKVENSGLGR